MTSDMQRTYFIRVEEMTSGWSATVWKPYTIMNFPAEHIATYGPFRDRNMAWEWAKQAAERHHAQGGKETYNNLYVAGKDEEETVEAGASDDSASRSQRGGWLSRLRRR